MAIMAFFALNQRSLCNERCKKVQNEISLKAIDAKEKNSYFVQCILQKTLCIFKLSHVHVCNGLAIEQHDCRGVFVWKLLENVVGILVFLSTLQWKEKSIVDDNKVHVSHPTIPVSLKNTTECIVWQTKSPLKVTWHHLNWLKKG